MISHEECLRLFLYDKATGILYWKEKPSSRANRIKVGDEAGSICQFSAGGKYKIVSAFNRKYLVHRLIWLYHYGVAPSLHIDHIDGDGLNNKIENLREVTDAENRLNSRRRSDNTSGHTGVYFQRTGWVAQAQINGKYKYLGRFKTLDEAIAARELANAEYGFHENHGSERKHRKTDLVRVEVVVPFGFESKIKKIAKDMREGFN